MSAHDAKYLALLPAVGLCSCVATSELPDTAAPVFGPVEVEPERQPLTMLEAMIRSGRESLAAGHYQAAYESLSAAQTQDPELTSELALDLFNAALGARDVGAAQRWLYQVGKTQDTTWQWLLVQELQNDAGSAACEVRIEREPRPLHRADDALAVWNQLRTALPADLSVAIPSSDWQLRDDVCSASCSSGMLNFPKLSGYDSDDDQQWTIGLVIPDADGFTVIPGLLHSGDGCFDTESLAFESKGKLLHVRAFVDRYREDWSLESSDPYASSGYPASNYGYAYASSGYQASSYGYASSGYQASSYGYASSGYNYGYSYCGGHGYGDYDYDDYDDCEIAEHVERDIILDVERGEIVLDIVRTGPHGSALGRVTMASTPAGSIVEIEACGVSDKLTLSYT